MKHFVCTGDCEGESSAPGVCQAEGCTKEGEKLTACVCEDSLHEEAHASKGESEKTE